MGVGNSSVKFGFQTEDAVDSIFYTYECRAQSTFTMQNRIVNYFTVRYMVNFVMNMHVFTADATEAITGAIEHLIPALRHHLLVDM